MDMDERNRIMSSSLECNGNAQEECHKKENTIKERSRGYEEWIKRVNDCFEESKECNNNLCNSNTDDNNNKPHVVREIIELKVHTLVKKDDERKMRKPVWTEKGKACLDQDRWTHDLYNEDEQKPVTAKELIDRYGYDIRSRKSPPPLCETRAASKAQKRRVRREKLKNRNCHQERHYDNFATKSLSYKTDVGDYVLRSPALKRRCPGLMGDSGLQVKGEEDVHRRFNSIMGTARKMMYDTIQVVETHITEVRNRAEEVLEELQQDAVQQLKRTLEAAERKTAELVKEEREAKRATSSTETTISTSGPDEVD